MAGARRAVRPVFYFFAYAAIAAVLIFGHGLLLETPYYWDEIGQFIPASLDLYQTGSWIAHSTLPNVHPPGLMAFLAGFWQLFGYSIEGTRVAMLLMAALGALCAFLLAIELCRDAPGTPAFAALAFLCVSPLFFAQSMLAQLDMPAMCFTALALLLFLRDRFLASASACVVLVLFKETGIVAPALFGCWLLMERRRRGAVWYCLPAAALAVWLIVLKQGTHHWLGNSEFAQYNLFYPLNPVRLAFALLRRAWYLFAGSGHFIGSIVLVWAFRGAALFRSRSWAVCGAFVALHSVAVSVLGGAVLERYLLPALPIVYASFALALWSLPPRPRNLAMAALLLCLGCANFVNPVYPFPFENNLAFVTFTNLEQEAATEVEGVPGVLATTFPMANAFRRPEFGYVSHPRKVRELPDFSRKTVLAMTAAPPDLMIVYDTAWDPFRLLSRGPGAWLMKRFYDFERPLAPEEIAQVLGMRVSRRWTQRGLSMSLLVLHRPFTKIDFASIP